MKQTLIERTGGIDLAMQCMTPTSQEPSSNIGDDGDLTHATSIGSLGQHSTQVPPPRLSYE